MRQTLSDSGTPTASPIFYDPWGLLQSGTVPTFGFTGEVQQGSAVYLRARWYTTTSGTFLSNDPFAGFPTQPYSLHPYQYGYSNPVLLTDPSGKCVGWLWGSAECQFIGWDNVQQGNLNWHDGQHYVTGLADAAIDTVTGTVEGVITLATSADARHAVVDHVRQTIQHAAHNPDQVPGMLVDAAATPFTTLYHGVVNDDPYLMGRGMFEAGSAVVGTAGGVTGLRQLLSKSSCVIGEITELQRLVGGPRRSPFAAQAQTGSWYGKYKGDIERWTEYAPKAYEEIRNMTDEVAAIARNTGWPEYRIQRIKNYLFEQEHILDRGMDRFDPNPDIADAWLRLRGGDFVKEDLDLLKHEYFESKFESLFHTNYRTAHEATIQSGRTWTEPSLP